MRIYLAAPFAARPLAQEIGEWLTIAEHEVTSSWFKSTREITEGTLGATTDLDHDSVVEHAQGDLNDIDAADLLVMLTAQFCMTRMPQVAPELLIKSFYSGGRFVEAGYAMARGKAVHIIGEPENIFARAFSYQHADIKEFTYALEHGIIEQQR